MRLGCRVPETLRELLPLTVVALAATLAYAAVTIRSRRRRIEAVVEESQESSVGSEEMGEASGAHYQHEPSPLKRTLAKEERESLIAEMVSKPSYGAS